MTKLTLKPISVRIVSADPISNLLDAWHVSRPSTEILNTNNHDEIIKILEMDLPINELVHLNLVCEVPVFLRELITTLRDHCIWARTSRVDNIVENWNIYNHVSELDLDRIEHLMQIMNQRIEKGESQDSFRSSLPVSYMTEFTWSVSLRSLSKFLRHLKSFENHELLKNLYNDFNSAIINALDEYTNDNISYCYYYKYYLSNIVPKLKHINYNEFTPENSIFTSNDNIMSIHTTIPFGLRAQLVRSRSLMINDNLIEAFTKNGGWSADNNLKIDTVITSTKSFLLELVSKRNCMLAQKDLWQPVLDILTEELGDEVKLPCSSGVCPFHKDCMERLAGRDPGVPCPMHYLMTKHKGEEQVPEMTDAMINRIKEYVVRTKRCSALIKASERLTNN